MALGDRLREVTLLAELAEHGAYHSPGWLAGRQGIAAWGRDGITAVAASLVTAGEAEQRWSPAKRVLMYRITMAGRARLAEATAPARR